MTDYTNDRGARIAREALLLAENPTHNGPDFELLDGGRSGFDTFKFYCHSSLAAELLFSISFLVVDVIFKILSPDPRQRSIPYQFLESTGDYVVNQAYNEEFVGETVSSGELYLYGAILPLILQMSLSYFRGVDHMHKTACIYAAGVGLTNILTNTIKIYVGYLRPIFYDVCDPNDIYEYCTSGNDDAARVSFPSGHSSLAFCGLGLLSFYLERMFGTSKLQEWRLDPVSGERRLGQTRPVRLERIFSILCGSPFLLAGFIAASRVVDNKHFPADVIGGSVLGVSIAKFVHEIWFSSCD